MKANLRLIIPVAAAILISSVASAGAESGGPRQFQAEGVLAGGEPISATIVASSGEEGRAKAALAGAMSRAQGFFSEILSAGGVADQLAGLGKGKALELSPTAFEFIKKARLLASQTDGFFDITAPSPKHTFIKSDWRRVVLDPVDRTISFKSDDIKLDLKRIALGYACDLMMEAISGDGFQNASAAAGPVTRNSGRDIYTPWDIVVGFGESTTTGAHRAYRYGVSGVGAATVTPGGLGSGLIDPLNKKRVAWGDELCSVTVIASDATTATAFALAAYTVGPKYAMKFIRGHPSVKGIVVDEQGNLYASKSLGLEKVAPYEKARAGDLGTDGGPDDINLRKREEKAD